MIQLCLCAILVCAPLLAQQIKIESGVTDDQVFQRDAGGKGELRFEGASSARDGSGIEARLTRKQLPLDGFDWTPIAKVAKGKWAGKVSGIPAGGPYTLEVRVAGTNASDKMTGLLIGDIWVLAGQSNMEGRGYLTESIPPHPMVHSFDMRDHWLVAEEPLHTRVDAEDRVYWFENDNKVPEKWTGGKLRNYLKYRDRGTGLGLPFAIEMVRRTGVPVGVVPCALGGTSMNQWSPALKDKGGDSLYGATLRRIRAVGGNITGVIWYQGESDATRKQATEFRDKFERFVAALRDDTGRPGLPFYYVQIGRFITDENIGDQWNIVQQAQLDAESRIAHSGMVAAVDGSLVDLAHGNADTLKTLGIRIANLACHDLFPDVKQCAELRRGPRPVSASMAGENVVKVSFRDVNGRLTSAGRVAGFTIHKAEGGAPLPVVYHAEVDPNDGSAILIRLTDKLPAGAVVRYGYGTDPYCNVTDQAGMAVPAFGPLPVK